MTDLSQLPANVRDAVERMEMYVFGTGEAIKDNEHWQTIRAELLRVTAERDAKDVAGDALVKALEKAMAARDRQAARIIFAPDRNRYGSRRQPSRAWLNRI